MKRTKKITKAVFPVAGLGTRFLPVTKAMPKELLPIIDKPLIQYAVEESIQAGIDTLIFVTGRHKRAIEDHFDGNKELEDALLLKGRVEQANMVKNILPKGVECIFIRQAEPAGLGDAVLCAERLIGDEAFMVLLADDFLINDTSIVSNDLVQNYKKTNNMQISVMEVEGREISNYGVVVMGENSNAVAGLVEKPEYDEAPSNLASIGRYVLTPDIFDTLRGLKPGSGNEIQLSDAINLHAIKGNVEAVKMTARRFDCGSVDGYLEAIQFATNRRKINSTK